MYSKGLRDFSSESGLTEDMLKKYLSLMEKAEILEIERGNNLNNLTNKYKTIDLY